MNLYKLITDGDAVITFYAPDLGIAGLVSLTGWQGPGVLTGGPRSTPYGAVIADEGPDATGDTRMPIFLFSRFDEWWHEKIDKERDPAKVLEERMPDLIASLRTVVVGSVSARRKFEADIDVIVDQGDKLRFIREHPMRTDTIRNATTARCGAVLLELDQRAIQSALVRTRIEEIEGARRRQEAADAERDAQVARVQARAERERENA